MSVNGRTGGTSQVWKWFLKKYKTCYSHASERCDGGECVTTATADHGLNRPSEEEEPQFGDIYVNAVILQTVYVKYRLRSTMICNERYIWLWETESTKQIHPEITFDSCLCLYLCVYLDRHTHCIFYGTIPFIFSQKSPRCFEFSLMLTWRQ